jgi:hypothetical protein
VGVGGTSGTQADAVPDDPQRHHHHDHRHTRPACGWRSDRPGAGDRLREFAYPTSDGWRLAGSSSIAYIAWSIWLIALGC